MSDAVNDMLESVRQEAEARLQALQRLLSTADAGKVFGQAVSSGGYTVIPVAEVASGGGFGSGMGFGAPGRRQKRAAEEVTTPEAAGDAGEQGQAAVLGAGGGGGGGGGAIGRPVAVIVLRPEGVEVKPVVDVTKVTLTALAVFAATAALSIKMLKR